MFSKISNMLGNAWDWGKNALGSLGNSVGKGFDMLKNGAMKAGKFVLDNHETIGNIVGGIGNILSNMPNSPLKQKMEQGLGGATVAINKFSNLRPSNGQRQQFNNNMSNRQRFNNNMFNRQNIPMRQNNVMPSIPQQPNMLNGGNTQQRIQFKQNQSII